MTASDMQGRTRRWIVLLFVLATLGALGFAIHLSLDSRHYFSYRPEDGANWTYDATGVAWVCGIMLAEAFIACLAIVAARPRALWLRCAIALVLLVPWALFSTMAVLHLPAYVLFHHLWVWVLVLVLLVAGIASASTRLVRRLRPPAPPRPAAP